MARNLGCAQTLFQPGSSRGCHQQHGMYLPYRCHVSTTKAICHAQTRFAGNLPSIPVRWEAGATGLTAVEAQVEVDGGRRFAVVPLAVNTQRPDEVRRRTASGDGPAGPERRDRPAQGPRTAARSRLPPRRPPRPSPGPGGREGTEASRTLPRAWRVGRLLYFCIVSVLPAAVERRSGG